MLLRPNCRAA
jgi:hypothetical protein